MKLIFKQRLFSWFDSYDIYDENQNVVFTVKGQLSWGHCLKIYGANGDHLGTVKERVITFLPKFDIYKGEGYVGCIKKKLSFFTPKFDVDYNGWHMEGNFLEWDYSIIDGRGAVAASISKELFRLTDTYVIEISRPELALDVLMLALAIDAEKCSRN